MKIPFNPRRIFHIIWITLFLAAVVTGSVVNPADQLEKIRSFSRAYEFDSLSWTLSALFSKLTQTSLKVDNYLPVDQQRDLVFDYLNLVNQTNQLENQLTQVIADPDQTDRQTREMTVREELQDSEARRDQLAPFVEQVLQYQLDTALIHLDMSEGGELIPPVLYSSEPRSYALIVSPRDEIKQVANIMLVGGLSLDEINSLEQAIEDSLDLSALVVGIGGVGLYPAMVIETGNLDWLIHVTGHEWTHNYLGLRPLGWAYGSSPDLTTINETIADLSADDIQQMTFQLFYPERLPQEPTPQASSPGEENTQASDQNESDQLEPPPFDFQAEMHQTRLEVDRLLEAGEIDQAERYMEQRRVFFWNNGYQIRRLNQAYFAFHGSYAAEPGGAAGQQGVDLGAELRDLKAASPSYRDFMHQVAWKWRLEQFEALFQEN